MTKSPQKMLVKHENVDKIIELKHPRTEKLVKFSYDKENKKLYELVRVDGGEFNAFFIDDYVRQSPHLLLTLPIDALFLALTCIPKDRFVCLNDLPIHDLFESHQELSQICDLKIFQVMHLVQLNMDKVHAWLKSKYDYVKSYQPSFQKVFGSSFEPAMMLQEYLNPGLFQEFCDRHSLPPPSLKSLDTIDYFNHQGQRSLVQDKPKASMQPKKRQKVDPAKNNHKITAFFSKKNVK